MSTTMLYRPADEPNPAVWDMNVEHRVFGEGEVEAALADGWYRHPNDMPAEGAEPQSPPEPKRKGRPPKEG